MVLLYRGLYTPQSCIYMKTKHFLQGSLSTLYFSLFYMPWLTINTQQLHASTWLPVCGPFWSFHLLPCHTFAPVAAKLHHTEVNKVKKRRRRHEALLTPVVSSSQFICWFLWSKPSSTWCSWRIISFPLGGFCFVYVETVRAGGHWYEARVVTTHLQKSITHTGWFPPEIHVLSHTPEKHGKQWHIWVLLLL